MQPFDALADPTRRRIVEILATGRRTAGELVGQFAMSAPAISQHLKVLRDAKLVRVRPEAQRRVYELDAAGIAEIDDWLAGVTRYWTEGLDAKERPSPSGRKHK
jgi:DNA-binding transcriptional ArsR family regulator